MNILMHLSDSFKELHAIDKKTGKRIYDPKKVQRVFGNKMVKALNDALLSDADIGWNKDDIWFDVAFSEGSGYTDYDEDTDDAE